eukprot:196781-Karenia_brevis.AAC.1
MGGNWKRSDVPGFSRKDGMPSLIAHLKIAADARAHRLPIETASWALGCKLGKPYICSLDRILHQDLLGGPRRAKLKLEHGVPSQSPATTFDRSHPLINLMMQGLQMSNSG